MADIGIFYGSMSGNTRIVAELIELYLPDQKAKTYDIFESHHKYINQYTNIILGVPTWGRMFLHEDWKIFLENILNLNFINKTIAIYGLGDQFMYSNAFADAMGIIYDALKNKGCNFIGMWPTDGYIFKKSNAIYNNKFVGLVIDEDNQSEYTITRIENWNKLILPHFH